RLFLLDGEITGFLELGEPLGLLPESVREDPELPLRFGAVGLALGSAIAAWFELVMLRQRLTWHLGRVQLLGRQGWAFVAAGLTAALMIGAALFATRGMPELVRAVAALAPAGVAYLVILRALGIGETADVIDPLRRIMGRVGIRR
ncbi:MAG: hypothetical protein AAGA99_23180, partial [Actinomycetota bacterium]